MFTRDQNHRDRCGLCGKHKNDVPKLIVGLHGATCSDCVHLCNDILRNEGLPTGSTDSPVAPQTDPIGSLVQSTIANLLIRVLCPHCQAHNLENSKYCNQCGLEFDQ